MLSLSVKIRKQKRRKVKELRKKGTIPAVLYGPKIENTILEMDSKEFGKIYKEAGESTLISLELPEKKLKALVLIHDVQADPVTGEPLHVDFFQPSLTEKTEAEVPLVFEGESKAVEDLGGTLVRNISEVMVKALPQELPHEIKVNIESLKTFEDEILIRDLEVLSGVEILKEPNEVVALVAPPEKVEEELEEPIEEKVEEVEKVEEKKVEKETEEEKPEKKEPETKESPKSSP